MDKLPTTLEELFNLDNAKKAMAGFKGNAPFDHCVIDDFFLPEIAAQLEAEIPAFDSEIWHRYQNAIEVKKVCNNWNVFPPLSYRAFTLFNSQAFLDFLSENIGVEKTLYSDAGLNGGGWHIHGRGGKLNTHLDYSLHPKLQLQRKLNMIIYLNHEWQDDWGGALGLWGNESDEAPGALKKSVSARYNRAVLFDTTQNSWHGLPDALTCPTEQFRKSIAIYYLCEPPANINPRGKALFAPTEEQKNDPEVLELIKKRSNVATSAEVYIKN